MIEIDYELSAQITNALRAQRRRRKAGFSPSALFAASEPGVWLDPSDLTTLFQDSAGTTPVTAAGQSVGFALSKSAGAVVGPELVANTAPNASVIRDGVTNTSYSAGNIMTAGRCYRVTYTITNNTSTTTASLRASGGGMNFVGSGEHKIPIGFNGTVTRYIIPTVNGSLAVAGDNVGVSLTVASFSVRQVAGTSHAYQTGAGTLKPVLQSGLDFDLSDDQLNCYFASAITGDVAYSGVNGMWVEEGVSVAAGGTLAIGPNDGPNTAQILRAVGDLRELVFIGRTLTEAERRGLGSRSGGYLERETAQRVVNGTFDTNVSGWSVDNGAGNSVSAGVVTITAAGGNGGLFQNIAVSPGKPHILDLPNIGANGFVYVYDAAGFTNLLPGFPLNSSSTKPVLFTPTGPIVRIRLMTTTGNSATFDNVSCVRLRPSPPALPWAGLSWASYGDSLTAQSEWQPYVAGDSVLRHTAYGTGGARISGAGANALWQDASVNALPTTARLLTVLGGTNDWVQNAPLGTIGSSDTTTFYGALNALLPKLQARCSSAEFLFVTPPYSEMLDFASRGWVDETHNTLGLTIADYASAMRAWASANSIALADANANSGIAAGNITIYMRNDGNLLHPNSAGGALIGNVVISALSTISPV